MKSKAILLALLAFAFGAQAARVSQSEVTCAAGAWAKSGDALDARLGTAVESAREFSVTNGYSFYAVTLEGGTVIMTSDTSLEPVVAFSSNRELDLSEGSPLLDLLRRDVAARAAIKAMSASAVRTSGPARLATSASAASSATSANSAEAQWADLLAGSGPSRRTLLTASAKPVSSISDVRVAPLVKSKWSQSFAQGEPCYNYYTPNNSVCGCTATAMSQIMRYFQYPTGEVEAKSFSCTVDKVSKTLTMQGGVYDWAKMTLVPGTAASLSEANRKAIGKLTSDAGIALKSAYSAGDTGADPKEVAAALRNAFGYPDAICYWNESGWSTGKGGLHTLALREKVIYANLDAGLPVQLGIYGYPAGHIGDSEHWAGHAVVADGYGYKDVGGEQTAFVHINMGWAGSDDMWYNIPEINAANTGATIDDNGYDFLYLGGATFNIFTNGTGFAILSGRITDDEGQPVEGAAVTAIDAGGNDAAATTSDSHGIYFFKLAGGARYDVSAVSSDGKAIAFLESVNLPATTGLDEKFVVTDSSKVGNSWGNDLVLAPPAAELFDGNVSVGQYSSLNRAIAAAAACGEPRIAILDAIPLKESVDIGFVCEISATNLDMSAALEVARIGGASINVLSGGRLVLSNVVFAASSASGAVVAVEAGGALEIGGTVDFGVPATIAAVRTADGGGFGLFAPITTGFSIDCASVTNAIGGTFGYVRDVSPAAVAESAAKIADIYDEYGEIRGAVSGNSLVWAEIPVPVDESVGYYVTDGNVTNTAARLDRLFQKYEDSVAGAAIATMTIRLSGTLSRKLTLARDLSIDVADGVVVTVGSTGGFEVTNNTLSVSGGEFSGYTGDNGIFLVAGGGLSLSGVAIKDVVGTAGRSGAVAVLSGTAALSGVSFDNCRAEKKRVMSYGGAVYLGGTGCEAHLSGVTITGCYASAYGGGVYAYGGSKLGVSGATVVRDNSSGNFAVDDICIAKATVDFKLDGELTGGANNVGVRYRGDTGNAAGDVFMTIADPSLTQEAVLRSARSLFSDVSADLEAVDPDGDQGERFAWSVISVDRRVASGPIRVVGRGDGVNGFYALLEDAFAAIDGDASVELLGPVTFASDIEVAYAVAISSSYGYSGGIERTCDASIRVLEGGSLTLSGAYIYGCTVDSSGNPSRIRCTKPLVCVEGGSFHMGSGAVVAHVWGDGNRAANGVTVYGGGEFSMESGALITDCGNDYYKNAGDYGLGGGLLVDTGTAYLRGGEITDCYAWRSGGAFVGSRAIAYVSGDMHVCGNGTDASLVPANSLVVSRNSNLCLDGKFTGYVGVSECAGGDTNIFGRVSSAYIISASGIEVREGASNFRHDPDGVDGVVLTNGVGEAFLVWRSSVVNGEYAAPDGTIYRTRYADDIGLEYATPEVLVLRSMVRDGDNLVLSFGNGIAGCWYTLYATQSLGEEFKRVEMKKLDENGPVVFTVPYSPTSGFYKVYAQPGLR